MAVSTGVASRRRGMRPFTRRALTIALLFQLPWIIGFGVFLLYPAAASFYYSFTRYNIINTPRWIGLANYQNLLGDQFFIAAVGNTAYIMLIGVPASIVFSFAVAMILNTEVKGIAIWRTLCFLPAVMP
ncbi:MAG TPA: hypothetical protein VFA18_05200, partial [Gemmataceae bacterium]|nr:hypothetical protein [Gemmataceae bacterium]